MIDAYEAYGQAARDLTTPTLIAGRNRFQAAEEENIVRDVAEKLRLCPSHRLLEVGCNIGILLTPLSRHVAEAVGVDHPSCIAKYVENGVPANVCLVAGRWPDTRPPGLFDRILVYSVLHYLHGADDARRFIDACLETLQLGGRLLLGDIPNEDARRRFIASDTGRRFHAAYVERKAAHRDAESDCSEAIFTRVTPRTPFLTDDFVREIVAGARGRGFESYLLPQPVDLPFSHTREDILIVRRG
jgi:SAM-dependent methyltransferase